MPQTDEQHMQRALDLARAASALASPNPTVGCILTLNETILGEGAHLYDHFDHAEIAALKQAAANGHATHGATAYVTLEPCAHHGRTGPCADALIAAGISRCVVAAIDPNPQTHNQGLARMRDAGITVAVLNRNSPQAAEARQLNDAFAFAIQHGGQPFVTLKAALSVDGKLAPPPGSRTASEPHWLTGEAARADVQQLRHASDAILTGIGTILADNPSLTDRTGEPRRRPLLRVILDADLRTPPTAQLFAPRESVISTEASRLHAMRSGETPVFPPQPESSAGDILIFCRAYASQEAEQALLAAGAQIHRLPDHAPHLNLHAILEALAARHIRSVLLEAGPTLNGSFLKANLVHKAVLYYSETELGLDALPFATGYPSPYTLQQSLTQQTRQTFPHNDTDDIRITGYLRDPWSP